MCVRLKNSLFYDSPLLSKIIWPSLTGYYQNKLVIIKTDLWDISSKTWGVTFPAERAEG